MTDEDGGATSAETVADPTADPGGGGEWSVPDCPHCGRAVWVVTVSGPGTATASPCGCPVAPGSLERE